MRTPTVASHFATLNGLVDAPKIADLDIAQIRCLLYLASVGRASAGDVVASSGMAATTSTNRRIAKLREGGLIARKRDRKNLRIVWLSLTAKGQLVAEKLAELYREGKPRQVKAGEQQSDTLL